jgi:hypothetical protein
MWAPILATDASPIGQVQPRSRLAPHSCFRRSAATASAPGRRLRNVAHGLVSRRASTVKSTRPADRSAPRGSAVSRLSGSTRSERRGVFACPVPLAVALATDDFPKSAESIAICHPSPERSSA